MLFHLHWHPFTCCLPHWMPSWIPRVQQTTRVEETLIVGPKYEK